MVTDFCPGGELFFHLHSVGRFTEDQAKFYFSEALLAIEHIHKKKIIFRDLKPENLLIDIDGHLKLVDFGLAKEDKCALHQSFCGSHEYLSPEMIQKNGYSRSVDFYSLGSFLYEMLTGLPPFWDEDREKLYDKILNQNTHFPKYLSNTVKSLLAGLLKKDPLLRLGSVLGIKEIKKHPWLSSVDWDSVFYKRTSPPFKPNATRPNFEPEFLSPNLKNLSLSKNPFSTESDPVFKNFYCKSTRKIMKFSSYYAIKEETELNRDRCKSNIFETSPTVDVLDPLSAELEKKTSPGFSSKKTDKNKIGPALRSVWISPKFVELAPVESQKTIKITKSSCNKNF